MNQEESFKNGKKETNLENAKKMKENGIKIELITKITGLSKKKINNDVIIKT